MLQSGFITYKFLFFIFRKVKVFLVARARAIGVRPSQFGTPSRWAPVVSNEKGMGNVDDMDRATKFYPEGVTQLCEGNIWPDQVSCP